MRSGPDGWRGRVGDGDGEGECDELRLDVVCIGREREMRCREGRRSETVVLACEMDVAALARRVHEDGVVDVADVRVVGEVDEQARSLVLGFGQLRGGARRSRA